MTRIVVKKIIWDSWNIGHIKKHKVTVQEAEEGIKNLTTHTIGKKGRYILIGRSGKRILSSIVRRKGPNTYYPVTVRDAAKKERKRVYEKEKN